MKKKEIFWLLGTIGLALILKLIFFGLDGFKTDATLDINIHDTYFVIANFHFIPLIFVLTFFAVYLFRTIKCNFKNITANLILMIATILFILILGKTIGILDFFGGPPNSGAFIREKHPVGSAMGMLSKMLFAIQLGLLVLLSYCGFKTGRNYKRESKR